MIAAGTRLGSHEVLALLGPLPSSGLAGGMGEVYQAHNIKLGRDLTIKVLPEAFAHDPQRLSRFQREAKLLASLNHTKIATIHGLEESKRDALSGDGVGPRRDAAGAGGAGKHAAGGRSPGYCPADR
jgi:hypothetical protein